MESTPAHVIVRGNNRQAIFKTDGDRVHFHKCLTTLAAQHDVAVHAYVFMTNHVHLLATPKRPTSLPATMQALGRRYVGYFNDLYERSGTLWEGRYKATLVETERYLLTCQRYIELNPVRAGMAGHPDEFIWSSYRHYAWQRPDDLLTPHFLHSDLGKDEEARRINYIALFEEDIDAETLERIRCSVQKGWALGGERFCAELEARGSRRAAPTSTGRRRKAPASQESESDSHQKMGV